MLKIRIILCFIILATGVSAQTKSYMFRVYLNDKGSTEFSIDNPEAFLSKKSVERRIKQNIAVNETDLPISQTYIADIEATGCKVVAKSKWLSTVSVCCSDSLTAELIKDLAFVDKVAFVWRGIIEDDITTKAPVKTKSAQDLDNETLYGAAYKQIAIHNGIDLHDLGYKGEGMEIAVIDAGFSGLGEDHLLLSTANIKGVKDFVYKGGDIFKSSNHGTAVMSCMATNASNTYVGTAPKAGYWLLRSEDARSEFPIEEDYWAAAAEYADSLGVDIINTSLGYSKFDVPELSYQYSQMNGKTAFITKAAEVAVSKGIFVVASAGNEGDKTWRHITAPGDGETTFTVGAITPDSIITAFSSRGATADGRIKPDVMAVGKKVMLVNSAGAVVSSEGTSFSSPVMCGLVACFWQANPHFTNREIAEILKESADRYTNPDVDYGYGIADMRKAMEIANNKTGVKKEVLEEVGISITTDSLTGRILVEKKNDDDSECSVNICALDGKAILSDTFRGNAKEYSLDKNEGRLFVIRISNNGKVKAHKVCL